MSDIFISYARPDRDKAEQLARTLETQGWSVWWDRELLAGHVFAQEIAEALAESKAVIVLWSQASVASNWVKDEAQEGVARGALVPVLMEKVALPLGFRQFEAADLSNWDGSPDDPGLQKVLRGVAELLGRPYTPPAVGQPRRLTWLYLGVGLALVAALGFTVYQWMRSNGPGPNVNNSNLVAGNNNNAGTQNSGGCDSKASRDAADLTGKGLTYIDKDGNHAAAILQFNEAIRVCADYVDAYFYRGQSYAVLGKKERAVSDFNQVIKLSSDASTDKEAQELIASLTTAPPPATPTPRHSPNANAASPTPTAGGQNANQNTNSGTPTRPPISVRDIFAADRKTRVGATTRLIVERKRDAGAVKEAVASALANPDNKSGITNTLVFLENVDAAILKQNRAEIEKLFAIAKDNGPETVEHIKKVRERMGG